MSASAEPTGVIAEGGRLWAATLSGVVYDPLAMRAEEVKLSDVAAGLSAQGRFNGQTMVFYSVAEHSLVMAAEAEARWGRAAAKVALMHDAPEAFLGDVIRPLKASMPAYHAAEAAAWRAVAAAFGLPVFIPAEIHALDDEMLAAEREALLPNAPEFPGLPPASERLVSAIRGLAPGVARMAFERAARRLFDGVER